MTALPEALDGKRQGYVDCIVLVHTSTSTVVFCLKRNINVIAEKAQIHALFLGGGGKCICINCYCHPALGRILNKQIMEMTLEERALYVNVYVNDGRALNKARAPF